MAGLRLWFFRLSLPRVLLRFSLRVLRLLLFVRLVLFLVLVLLLRFVLILLLLFLVLRIFLVLLVLLILLRFVLLVLFVFRRFVFLGLGLFQQRVKFFPELRPVGGFRVGGRAEIHGGQGVFHRARRNGPALALEFVRPSDGFAGHLRPVACAGGILCGESSHHLGQRERWRIFFGRRCGVRVGRDQQHRKEKQRRDRRRFRRCGRGRLRRRLDFDFAWTWAHGEFEKEADEQAPQAKGERPLVALDEPNRIFLGKLSFLPGFHGRVQHAAQIDPGTGVAVGAVGFLREFLQRRALEFG